jgi:hypothetical protein
VPCPSFSRTKSEYYSPEHKISIDTVFGFNNSIKQSSYNQAVFFIKNDGKDFSGKLSVKVGTGYSVDGPYSIESKKIYLPELSKKRIYIYFDCSNIYPSYPVFFELESDDGKKIFSVNLTKEKKINIINSHSSRNLIEGFLTVVISDKNYGYNFLSGVNTAPLKKGMPGTYNRIGGHTIEYPAYESLPDDVLGYDGVNLILLSGSSVSKLNYDQKKAILRYLNEGGNVLISKSDNDLWMENEFIKDLMPVELTGRSKTLDRIGGYVYNAAPRNITQSAIVSTTSYPVLDVTLKKGAEVFARYDDSPMIIRKLVGNGRLMFTAFNPSNAPFAGAKETLEIFSNIFNILSTGKGVPLSYQFSSAMIGIFNILMDAIITQDIIKKVVIFLLATFIIYIIFLGPVNYFFLKFKRRLEYAWFTIPTISILFSLVFLLSGYIARGSENRMFTYNIVKVYDSNDLRIKSFMSVFASRADSYDVDIERQNISVKNFDMNRSVMDDQEVEIGETIKVKGINIKKWSVRNFTITGYVDAGSNYYATATMNESGTYYIDYNLPFNIEATYLITGGQVHKINLDNLSNRELKVGDKNIISYTSLIDFVNYDMMYVDSKKGAKAKKSYSRGTTADLQSFLRKKNLLGNYKNDFFVVFTKDPVLDYELKGTNFSKDDKTVIIIPVEES